MWDLPGSGIEPVSPALAGRFVSTGPPCVDAKLLQSCLTLCDSVDCSPTGSSVYGISQARMWHGLPFPSPGSLPDPGIEPGSPALEADSLPSEPPGKPRTRF